jgi:hypothetical protein
MNEFDITVREMLNDPDIGCSALYVKTKTGEYDPETGEVASSTKTLPVRGCLLDADDRLSMKFNTSIQAGDKQFLMQPPEKAGGIPLKIEPESDSIKIGSTLWRVVAIKETNPTGASPILYEIILRR